jgi:uncharacterized protein YbjT (DUF2867 family)
MNDKVLVVGATGTVGSALVAELVKAGVRVRAATRDPARVARGSFPSAVEIVPFDLERAATFDAALDGVGRAFLIARPGDEHSDRLALPLLDVMEKRGVRHVVNLSAMGAELRPSFALRKIELHLEASSMAFTHLRPNWFMQVFTSGGHLDAVRARTLRLPAALAKIAWIDARDVAAVAAVALLSGRAHTGKAYTLTGGEALSYAEVAALIGESSGIQLRYEPSTEDEARRVLADAGFPPPWVERLIGFYRLVREGLAAPVSPAVEELLGKPARTFAAFAREHAAMWRA